MTTLNPTQKPAPSYSGPQPNYQDIRPLDRPDLRLAATRSLSLANVAYSLSDLAQNKLTEVEVAKARVEGAKSGTSRDVDLVGADGKTRTVKVPQLVKMEGTGAVADSWNRSALQSYGLRLETATMQGLAEIETLYKGDPEKMQESIEAFTGALRMDLPAELMDQYSNSVERMSRPMVLGAMQAQIRQVAEDKAQAMGDYRQSVAGQLIANASRDGAAGIAGAVLSAETMNGYADYLASNIDGTTYTQADAVHDYQSLIREVAPAIMQAQFAQAKDKPAWLASFFKSEIGISIPHADPETGTIKPGVYDQHALITLVPPEQLDSIINGFQADIRMDYAEKRARVAEAKAAENERLYNAQSDILAVWDDVIAEGEATGKAPITASEIAAAFPPRQAEKYIRQLNTAVEGGSIRRTVATQTPEEDAALVESLTPQPGTPGYAEQVELRNRAITEIEAKRKALATDPATYAIQTDPRVAASWEAAAADPTLIPAAIAETKRAQLALGVPPEKVQVMPQAHAAGLASTIMTASPDTVGQTIDGLQATYGDEGMQQIMAAGVPPMVKLVAFASVPELGAYRQSTIQAMQIPESDLKAQTAARGYSVGELDDALAGLTVDLQNTLPAGVAGAYLAGIRQLALFKIANDGMPPAEAAAFAWSAFPATYQFNGTYRVPVRWDGDRVAGGLTGFIANIGALDVRPAITGAGGVVDREFATAETIRSIQAGHYRWVTNSDETGVILAHENPGEGPILLSNGQPIEVRFDEAVTMPQGGGGATMIRNLQGLSGTN